MKINLNNISLKNEYDKHIGLLPCPFCGNNAALYEEGHREYADTYKVMCVQCRVQTLSYQDADKAIEVWNRRTKV